jgi:hypothetical protein
VFYINLPFCAIGLVAVPIWLRYEEKGVPSDGVAVSGSARQSPSNTSQQMAMVPEKVTRRSETPSVDWDASTLNEHDDRSFAVRDRSSVIDWDVSTLHAGAATTGDRSSAGKRVVSTLDGQAVTNKVTIGHKLSSVDWIGSTLMVASSTSILVGLSWGGNKYQWQSSAVLVPIVAGLEGIVITVLYEKRYANNPFLRLAIFQHWSGIVVSICTVIQGYLVSAASTKHYNLHA